MAKCTKCGKEVGCSCSLIGGSCHTCYNQQTSVIDNPVTWKQTQTSNPSPNTEFDKILNQKGLTKTEKLKRINDILEKGVQDATNQS
jgi:hypothetical protein